MGVREELYEEYNKEIRSWDWNIIVERAKANPWPDEGDGQFCSTVLGTVFGLMPSGKYYCLLSSNNVEPCMTCNGDGNVLNENWNHNIYAECDEEQRNLRLEAMRKYGYFYEGKWPQHVVETLEALDARRDAHAMNKSCPDCDGEGSVEVLRDTVYGEVLEEVANERGGWIESGEGCPTDILFVMTV